MTCRVVVGDLLKQPVEVIVNPWNRNIIPWWLLLPQGVSARSSGRQAWLPFTRSCQSGPDSLGGAIKTSAGRLPYKAIVRLAGISMFWRATKRSVQDSVRNAWNSAEQSGYASIALPLMADRTGGKNADTVQS